MGYGFLENALEARKSIDSFVRVAVCVYTNAFSGVPL